MKAWCIIAVIALSSTLSPYDAFALPFEVGGKGGFENFKWQEFTQNGQLSAEEKGVRMAISGFLHSKPETVRQSHLIYGAELKIYGGSADYQDNNPANANRDYQTDWGGTSLEGEGGLRLGQLPFAWDFIGKLGFEFGYRTMDDAMDVSTRNVQAEEQEYDILNLRLGTGPAWQAGNWQGQAIVGVKYPLAASVIIPDKKSNYDNNSHHQLEFALDGRVTPFFTFSNQVRITEKLSIKLDAYYDAYKFKRSGSKTTDTDSNQTVTVAIPESKQVNYGIQGGVSFEF